jgi:vacuolar-type H+-ATPase subunit F/Vma7
MTNHGQSTIAVVGDADLVMLMRLAGIGTYHAIEKTETIENDIRQVMQDLIDDTGVSIIAIQADFAGYVRDMIDRVSRDKRLTPVIIEVPSKMGESGENAAAYYRSFVRKFVGFDIEI